MPEPGVFHTRASVPPLCLSLSLTSVLGFLPDSRCVFSHDQRHSGFVFDTTSPDSGHPAPMQDLFLRAALKNLKEMKLEVLGHRGERPPQPLGRSEGKNQNTQGHQTLAAFQAPPWASMLCLFVCSSHLH